MDDMNMFLVDTSVWVNFFRNRNTDEFKFLDKMLTFNMVATCAPVRAEIVSGSSNKREFNSLRDLFGALVFLHPPEKIWEHVEESRFLLARKGVQSSIIDLWIAWTAYFNEVVLWTLDKDFQYIQKIVPFRLKGR